MLITPSPLGVSGRAVRVSVSSCHYPGWAMLITPSPLGVSGRAVRVSQSDGQSESQRVPGSGRVSPAMGSAPDRGKGRGQSWPVRLRPPVSVAAGPPSRPQWVASGRTRTEPPRARSWSRSCAPRMICEMGHGPVTSLAAAVRWGRDLATTQVRYAGPPPYLDFIAGRPFLFRCTLIAVARFPNAADAPREAQAFHGLLSSALPRPPLPRNP